MAHETPLTQDQKYIAWLHDVDFFAHVCWETGVLDMTDIDWRHLWETGYSPEDACQHVHECYRPSRWIAEARALAASA